MLLKKDSLLFCIAKTALPNKGSSGKRAFLPAVVVEVALVVVVIAES